MINWTKTNQYLVINITGKKPIFLDIADRKDLMDEVLECIRNNDEAGLTLLLDKKENIKKWSDSYIYVDENDIVRFKADNSEIPNAIGKKIIAMHEENLPYQPLINFWTNLKKNPSQRSIDQLFGFLEANHHPITPDGKFIAYKKVTRLPDGRLVDSHTQKICNEIGQIVQMNRDNVNPDPNQTCSTGLHVASWDYAKDFSGNVLVEVEVNPKDVVAVPVDYNQQKMRTCEYKVRSVYEDEKPYDTQLVDKDKVVYLEDESFDDEDEDFDDLDEMTLDFRKMSYTEVEDICREYMTDWGFYPQKLKYISGGEFIRAATQFLVNKGFTVKSYYGVTKP